MYALRGAKARTFDGLLCVEDCTLATLAASKRLRVNWLLRARLRFLGVENLGRVPKAVEYAREEVDTECQMEVHGLP